MPSPVISLCNIVLHLLVRHTALLRRLSSHSAHSTHFPFSNWFLEVHIYFYTEISKGYQRDSKLFLLENKFNSLMEQIIVQKQNSEKTKKIRHDMKNHLTNIRFLIDSGETTAAMSLLDQVTDNVKKKVSETIDTGNSFVDAVLLSKTALCREKDIDFSYSVQPLENIKIGAVDLSSLLSNLLDNAVEAAAQTTEPFVRLTITKYNAYYTICVENSYMGKKSLKESVGALISTKSDKAPHVDMGLGLFQILHRNMMEIILGRRRRADSFQLLL